MFADVIQHTNLGRKRADAWAWAALVLAAALTALLAARQFAPTPVSPSAPVTRSQPAAVQTAPAASRPPAETGPSAIAPAQSARRRQPERRRTGVPLDAAAAPAADYEILSAAELDSISQARN